MTNLPSRFRWLWGALLLAPSMAVAQPAISAVGTAFGAFFAAKDNPTVSPGSFTGVVAFSNGPVVGPKVLVNGESCDILLGALNAPAFFRVPTDAKLGAGSIVVVNNGQPSQSFPVSIVAYTPQIELNAGAQGPDAFHADGSRVTNTSPAAPGERISLYATGLGGVDPPPLPSMTVGGFQANVESVSLNNVVEFLTASTLTNVAGVYTVTFTMPPALPSGSFGIVIGIGGQTAGPYQIPVLATGLVLSERGSTFRAVAGSPTIQQRKISVAAASQVISWTATVATISGGNWLQASPANGVSDPAKAPPILTISANAANLAPSDYYGTVTIKPVDTNSQQIISVVLSVLPAGQSPGPTVEPTGVVFTASPSGAIPALQTSVISNPTTATLTFSSTSTFSGTTAWFKYQPALGTVTPGQPFGVSVQPTGNFPAGVYTGAISFLFSDGNTRVVNLAMVVAAGLATSSPDRLGDSASSQATASCTPTKLLPVLTLLGVNFTSPVGWPTPIEATILDDCGTPLTTGTVVASFSNGDVPLALAPLQNGQWAGTWVPVNPVTVSLIATLNAQGYSPAVLGKTQVSGAAPANPTVPIVNSGGVVGTASYTASPAPGAFISVFGAAMADNTTSATQLPLPTTLGTTSVIVGGVSLPLVFVSAGQINALLPYGYTTGAKYQVIIQRANAISTPETIAILNAQPAVFTVDLSGKGQGHIYKITSDGGQFLASAAARVTAGDVLTIYCAGLGEVSPLLAAGVSAPLDKLENTVNAVTATVGGVSANVLFAGLTPGFTGLYQVNLTVPSGVAPGAAVPVVLSEAGQASVPVTIGVK